MGACSVMEIKVEKGHRSFCFVWKGQLTGTLAQAVIVSNVLALLFFNLVSLAGGKKWESRVWRPGLKAWVQKFGHEGLGQGLVPGTNGMVLEAWSWRPGARGLGLEN